ncbi:MAG: GntR family transcriptional regulator [Desulfobacteraceae bacterium]|nr:GntR family transcriptional regulator [Desulfobacteraceae bacterium]
MRSQIYDILRDRIIKGYYKPGESLSELKLAKEFKVSRTPVREALIGLSAEENFVTIVPNLGARVSDINLRDFQYILEVRLMLERGIARLAAHNVLERDIADLENLMARMEQMTEDNVLELIECDKQFHQLMVQATQNPFLAKYASTVLDQFNRLQNLMQIKPNRMQADMPVVIAALKENDADKLEKLLLRHVENFVTKVKNLFHIGTYA